MWVSKCHRVNERMPSRSRRRLSQKNSVSSNVLQTPTHPTRPTAIATTKATVLPSRPSPIVPAAPVALALVPVAVFVPPERLSIAVPVGLTPPAVFVVGSEVRLLPTLLVDPEAELEVIVVATIEVSGVPVLTVMVPVSVGVDVSEVGIVKPDVMEREVVSIVKGSEAMRFLRALFWCRLLLLLLVSRAEMTGRTMRIAELSLMAS